MAMIKEELNEDDPPPVGEIFIKKEEDLMETPDTSKDNHLYIKTPVKRKVRVRKKIAGFPFQCQLCDAKYQTKMAYDYHLLTHTGARPHVCHLCGKAYRGSALLRLHIMDHTGERPHKCQVCGKGFKEGRQLKKHMMNHTGERPFKCNLCEATFKCKISLESHLVIHDNTRSHECMVCNKRFRQIQSLSRHLNLHRDKRPHKCEMCGSGYAERKQLKLHMMDHTGERPFKCHLCKAGFKIENTLRKHIATHKGDHECSICSVKFCSANRLTQHKKTHKSSWEMIRRQPVQRVDESLLSCTICNIPFKTKESKERHQLLHASREEQAAASVTNKCVENIGKDKGKPSQRDVGTVIDKPEVRDAGTNVDYRLGQDIGINIDKPSRKDVGIGTDMTDSQAVNVSDKMIKQHVRPYIGLDKEIQSDGGLNIEKPDKQDIGINTCDVVERSKINILKSRGTAENKSFNVNRKDLVLSNEGVDLGSEGSLRERAENQMRMNNETIALQNGMNNVLIGCSEPVENMLPPNALIVSGIPPNQIGTIVFGNKIAPSTGRTFIIGRGVASSTGPVVLGTSMFPHSAIIRNGVILGQAPSSILARDRVMASSAAAGNGVLANPIITGSGVLANQVVTGDKISDSVAPSNGELPHSMIVGNGVLKTSVATGNGVLTNSKFTGTGFLPNSATGNKVLTNSKFTGTRILSNSATGNEVLTNSTGILPSSVTNGTAVLTPSVANMGTVVNSVTTGKVVLPNSVTFEKVIFANSVAIRSGASPSVATRNGVLPNSGASGNGFMTSVATYNGTSSVATENGTSSVAGVRRFVPNSFTKNGVLTTSATTEDGVVTNSLVTGKGVLTTSGATGKRNIMNSKTKGAGVLTNSVDTEVGVLTNSVDAEYKVLHNSVSGNGVKSTAKMNIKQKTMRETIMHKNIDTKVGPMPRTVDNGKGAHIKPRAVEARKTQVLSHKRGSGMSPSVEKQRTIQESKLNRDKNSSHGNKKESSVPRKITKSSAGTQKLTHPVSPVGSVTDSKDSLTGTVKYTSNKIKLTGGKQLVPIREAVHNHSSHHVKTSKIVDGGYKRPGQTVKVVEKFPSFLGRNSSDTLNREQLSRTNKTGKNGNSSCAQILNLGNTVTKNIGETKGEDRTSECANKETYLASAEKIQSSVSVAGDKPTATLVRSEKLKTSVKGGEVLNKIVPDKRILGPKTVKHISNTIVPCKKRPNTPVSGKSVSGDEIASNGVSCISMFCDGVSGTVMSQKKIVSALCSEKLGTEVTCTKISKSKVSTKTPVRSEIVCKKLPSLGGTTDVKEKLGKSNVTMDSNLNMSDSPDKQACGSVTVVSQQNNLGEEQPEENKIDFDQNKCDNATKNIKVVGDSELKEDDDGEENMCIQTGKSVVLTPTSCSDGNYKYLNKGASPANITSTASVVTVVADSKGNGNLVSEVFGNVPDAVASLKGGSGSNPANLIGLVPNESGFPIILLDSTQFTREALRNIPHTIMKAGSSLASLGFCEQGKTSPEKKTVFRVDAHSDVKKGSDDSCLVEALYKIPHTPEKEEEVSKMGKGNSMSSEHHKSKKFPKRIDNLKRKIGTKEKGMKPAFAKHFSPTKTGEAETNQENLCYVTIPAKTSKSSEGNGTIAESAKKIIEINTSQDSYSLADMDKCSSNGKRRKSKFTKRIMELKGMLDATFDSSYDKNGVTWNPSSKRHGKIDKTSEKEWRIGLGEDPDSPPVCMVIPGGSDGLDMGKVDKKKCENRGKILFTRLCKDRETSVENITTVDTTGNLEARSGNYMKEENSCKANSEKSNTDSENCLQAMEPHVVSQTRVINPTGDVNASCFTEAEKTDHTSSSRKRKRNPLNLLSEGTADVFKVRIKSGGPISGKIAMVEAEKPKTVPMNENENIVEKIGGKKICLKKDSFSDNLRNLSDVEQVTLGESQSEEVDVEMVHSCNEEKIEKPDGGNQRIGGNGCIFDINNVKIKEEENTSTEVDNIKISCVKSEEEIKCDNLFMAICKQEEDLEDISVKEMPLKSENDLQETKIVPVDDVQVKEEELEEWELIYW
ncbi:uncharacterized protein LOC143023018 [Oratosquilla oratoria]|uniref:uncharacterized protein LOC143023018 n=1 Tax=Oratosquilla oratoria TaxID=337810 RepID=UPI003F76E8C6